MMLRGQVLAHISQNSLDSPLKHNADNQVCFWHSEQYSDDTHSIKGTVNNTVTIFMHSIKLSNSKLAVY
jgi:hypothetical protein